MKLKNIDDFLNDMDDVTLDIVLFIVAVATMSLWGLMLYLLISHYSHL